jgi:Opioid growth factor receptor (OGFr) conserved region
LFMLNSPIIGFYSGTEPDHRGRYLHEIQQWPDEPLESVHDYIQRLFPLPERSEFNVLAPVLNPETVREFRTSPDLRENLLSSFLRMMNFYGLEAHASEQVTVVRMPTFATKAAKWLTPGNHNHLRITRILRCLTVLGLEPEARAFFSCLAEIYEDEQNRPIPAISNETMEYWRKASGQLGG